MEVMLLTSLSKIFEDQRPEPWNKPKMQVLKNQRGAFQIAWKGEKEEALDLKIQGLPRYTAYQVVMMQSDYPCHEAVDALYLRTDPGPYPDLLRPLSPGAPISSHPGVWQALWISFENLESGSYEVSVSLGTAPPLLLSLEVLEECLPPQTLYHTEWFHGDCLADYYGVEVFSEEHWQAIEGFLKGAARCGVNMILTPILTPPLDTEPGGERTTIQLLDITLEDGMYRFGFQKLGRWIHLCRKYEIPELEFSHLFTQWGAAAAPKVMVRENGAFKQKFGWDSPAVGGEYTVFLRQMLKALKDFLLEEGIWDHCWFHISDEPSEDQRQAYEAARHSVMDLLPEDRCIDALSSFEFYRQGVIKRPVVCEDHLEPFVKAKVPGLFTYYCTAQGLRVPNRFFAMPSGRNRILGTLLYVYNLSGFLHWGLNFYNSQFSKSHIDPFRVTDAGGHFPSGDPFLLYPGENYQALPSIRSEVLYEGLQDLRLLQLAETKVGREQVLQVLNEIAGYPMDMEHYPVEYAFFKQLQERMLPLIRAGR